MKRAASAAYVINVERDVVDLDAARPRPALSDATNDELVRLLTERARADGLWAGR